LNINPKVDLRPKILFEAHAGSQNHLCNKKQEKADPVSDLLQIIQLCLLDYYWIKSETEKQQRRPQQDVNTLKSDLWRVFTHNISLT